MYDDVRELQRRNSAKSLKNYAKNSLLIASHTRSFINFLLLNLMLPRPLMEFNAFNLTILISFYFTDVCFHQCEFQFLAWTMIKTIVFSSRWFQLLIAALSFRDLSGYLQVVLNRKVSRIFTFIPTALHSAPIGKHSRSISIRWNSQTTLWIAVDM